MLGVEEVLPYQEEQQVPLVLAAAAAEVTLLTQHQLVILELTLPVEVVGPVLVELMVQKEVEGDKVVPVS